MRERTIEGLGRAFILGGTEQLSARLSQAMELWRGRVTEYLAPEEISAAEILVDKLYNDPSYSQYSGTRLSTFVTERCQKVLKNLPPEQFFEASRYVGALPFIETVYRPEVLKEFWTEVIVSDRNQVFASDPNAAPITLSPDQLDKVTSYAGQLSLDVANALGFWDIITQ